MWSDEKVHKLFVSTRMHEGSSAPLHIHKWIAFTIFTNVFMSTALLDRCAMYRAVNGIAANWDREKKTDFRRKYTARSTK